MTCEEWRNGYKVGFDDGYEKAKRDLQRTFNPLFPDQPMQYEPRCSVCGIRWDKFMGYVCMRDNCPIKAYSHNGNPNLVPVSDTDTGC